MSNRQPAPATTAARTVRLMKDFGFAPTRTMSADYIEFERSYSDPQGRVARVVAQFVRPVAPHSILAGSGAAPQAGEIQLRGFSVTVQAQIPADIEAVAERAPVIMTEDLQALVEIFAQGDILSDAATPSVSLVTRQCGICGQQTNEFLVQNDIIRCRQHVQEDTL